MIQTVGEFASELKMPVSEVLKQLNRAGVNKHSPFDMLSGPDKAKLLDYLRRSISTERANPNTRVRILLRRPTREQQRPPEQESLSKGLSHSPFLLDFIVRHKIPIDRVYNATGMKPSIYGPAMSAGGYEIAVGVTPCKKEGHTIRTRSGECAVCNPAALAFQKRFSIEGYVYLAHSERLKLVKVGFSRDVQDRQYMLNLLAYGGAADWQIIKHALIENGGAIELQLQQRLSQHKAPAGYIKQGSWVECNELFQCSVAEALLEFEKVVLQSHADVSETESVLAKQSDSQDVLQKPSERRIESEFLQAGLSNEQLLFLVRTGVPLERVFNAKGMGPGMYGAKMKEQDKWVAFNVSPCRKAGHTLRDRKGHCVQCDSANISYVRRHDESGTVYVAFSTRTGLVKVGTATRSDRVDQLNSYRYGGASDWRKIHAINCERAGKVESLAHSALDQFRAKGEYFKDGGWIACDELFKCDISVAIKAVEGAIKIVSAK